MAMENPKRAKPAIIALTLITTIILFFTLQLFTGSSKHEVVTRAHQLIQTARASMFDSTSGVTTLTRLNSTKIAIPFGHNDSTHFEFLKKRAYDDEEWEVLMCVGERILDLMDTPTEQAALDFANNNGMQRWSDRIAPYFENPASTDQWGWVTQDDPNNIRNLRVNAIRTALDYYHLSTDPGEWDARTIRHSQPWMLNGVTSPASTGYFSFLVNKRASRATFMWTSMFSPEYMIARNQIATTPPPLDKASDVLYLEYYRFWAVTQRYQNADSNGGSPIPAPRYIIIRQVTEEQLVGILQEIKKRSHDNSPRVGAKKWPGERYTRDNDAFYAILSSPMGRTVNWFLVHHKHIWGAKSVGRMRLWATKSDEDDYNLLFEIIDPPTPSESADEAAGPEQPPPKRLLAARMEPSPPEHLLAAREYKQVTVLRSSRGIRRLAKNIPIHSRLVRQISPPSVKQGDPPVPDWEWNAWQCIGKAMKNLMDAPDDAAADKIAQNTNLLFKWRGKTTTQWTNPTDLEKYGWTVSNIDVNNFDIEVGGGPEASRLSDQANQWRGKETLHENEWKDEDGQTQRPTRGNYKSFFNHDLKNPAMIWAGMFSPWHMQQAIGNPNSKPKLPPLAKASDITFLTYYKFWTEEMGMQLDANGGSRIPGPNFVYIEQILEDEAVERVFPEMLHRGLFTKPSEYSDAPPWPGVTFQPGSPGFNVILSTKQGRAVSAFLFNHKKEFGSRTVTAITFYGCTPDGWDYCLQFSMGGDAHPAAPIAPACPHDPAEAEWDESHEDMMAATGLTDTQEEQVNPGQKRAVAIDRDFDFDMNYDLGQLQNRQKTPTLEKSRDRTDILTSEQKGRSTLISEAGNSSVSRWNHDSNSTVVDIQDTRLQFIRRDSAISLPELGSDLSKSLSVEEKSTENGTAGPVSTHALEHLHSLISTSDRVRTRLQRRLFSKPSIAILSGDKWNEYVCTGEIMYLLMNTADAAALENIVKKSPLVKWQGRTQTDWHNPEDLEYYGWVIDEYQGNTLKGNVDSIAELLRKAGLPTDMEAWDGRDVEQRVEWIDDFGTEQEPSEGKYHMLMTNDAQKPVLLIHFQHSPAMAIQDMGLHTEAPPLERASDVQFLNYYTYWSNLVSPPAAAKGGGHVPAPVYIIIQHVLNEEATQAFLEINTRAGHPDRGYDAPKWDEDSLHTPDTEIYKLLLGLPQGRGVAMFLFQHKAEFGVKTVKSIRWVSTSESKKPDENKKTHFIFEIGVPDPLVGQGTARGERTFEIRGEGLEGVKAKL